MKKILSLILIIVCLFLLLPGCENAQLPSEGSSENTTTDEVTGTGIQVIPFGDSWPMKVDRDTWNIEMSLYEAKEEVIMIDLKDNDNKGFYHSPYYFILEYLDGDEWVYISNPLKEYSWFELIKVIPSTKEDYITTRFFILPELLPRGTVLKKGHYRFTKILDDKPFSCEFDLNFDWKGETWEEYKKNSELYQ